MSMVRIEFARTLERELTALHRRIAELEKDKARLSAFVNIVWGHRWEPNTDDLHDLFSIAAEVRSGNYKTIDAAMSKEPKK